MGWHYTLPKTWIDTFGAMQSNEITKDYYWFLVGQINAGTIHKAVARYEDKIFNCSRYYLISVR